MKTIEEIQQEFKDSLEIPTTKPTKKCLVCPVGLIGSGKTTVIKPIAKELNLVRVSNDEYRILLKQNGHGYETIKSFLNLVRSELLNQGHSIAIDANAGGQTSFNFITRAREEFGVEVYWLNINTPDKYAEAGLRQRNSPLATSSEDWIKNRAQQKQRMETLKYEFDFFCEFDISRADLRGQISSCIQKLRTEIY